MLNVMVVDDEPVIAETIRDMINLHARFRVVGVAEDETSALQVAASENVHIAFVDVHLARLDTGYRVADELCRRGVSCIMVSGDSVPFPMPELIACSLIKPFSSDTVEWALRVAETDLYRRAPLASSEALAHLS